MIKWFGSNDAATKQRVREGLSAISAVLNDPEPFFRNDVAKCNEVGALAWVLPGEKNDKGQFIIDICEKAVNYGCDICIVGTIVHEAAHHPALRAKDNTYDKNMCLDFAQNDREKAITNAENWGYFLRDLNGQL